MEPEWKEKWIAALRSGEYKQGYGRLCTIKDGSREYCCLGVLCDVVGATWYDDGGTSIAEFDTDRNSIFLPRSIERLVGLKMDGEDDDPGPLVGMNDGWGENDKPQSFAVIAQWIEDNL